MPIYCRSTRKKCGLIDRKIVACRLYFIAERESCCISLYTRLDYDLRLISFVSCCSSRRCLYYTRWISSETNGKKRRDGWVIFISLCRLSSVIHVSPAMIYSDFQQLDYQTFENLSQAFYYFILVMMFREWIKYESSNIFLVLIREDCKKKF